MNKNIKEENTQAAMAYSEFCEKLKELNLSKRDFAGIANISYNTVANWSYKPMPAWVANFLKYYEDAQKFYIIQRTIK
ncbi:MAG: hypothetical protein LBF71_04710 [Campylobacteraceae bacterium]|jgi:hypothetical protein|nr:hypothetical protein [Campylobacteraceae bacterium]